MREALRLFATFVAFGRSLSNIVCVLFSEGRCSLLERAKATTDLRKLAVRQRELDIEFQRANATIDLIQKVEKIDDHRMRDEITRAILSRRCGFLTPGELLPSTEGNKIGVLMLHGRAEVIPPQSDNS